MHIEEAYLEIVSGRSLILLEQIPQLLGRMTQQLKTARLKKKVVTLHPAYQT
jgi:hypothetical protein